MTLTSIDNRRYTRHFPLIGQQGQVRLFNSRILCVGAGGLGSPVLQYLAAAGIGTLGIIDGDQVEISNLQRQVIFTPNDIGKNKAVQAKHYLEQFNPSLKVITYEIFLREDNAEKTVRDFEIIIDCTDNYRTRYLLNNVCVKHKKPLIFAGIHQFQGQCSVFNYKEGPCYCCLYEEALSPKELIGNCTLGGVLGVLPGILGCIQATEAIKILLNKEKVLSGRLLTIDVLSMKVKEFIISKNPNCPCCIEGKSISEFFPTSKDQEQIQEIEVKTLSQWLEKSNADILLIDVREFYERDICHIGGLHIPLCKLNKLLTTLPRDKFIVCYCKSGQRSYYAAQLLKDSGFTQVSSLKGGILAWIDFIDSSLASY
ncbi:MAG: ThiF family adenylyltransferase [Coxiella endosymbiont of Dermacentor nuttalli]